MTKLISALKSELMQDQIKPIFQDAETGDWVTRGQVEEDVARLKQRLIENKIGNGDRVLIALENSIFYPALMQTIWELGAIAMPIADTTPGDELRRQIATNQYSAIFVQNKFVSDLSQDLEIKKEYIALNTIEEITFLVNDQLLQVRNQAIQVPIKETDLAMILHTSGTTGKPKSVGLTQELLYNGAIHDRDSHQMTANDTALILMPMFHVNAQVMTLFQMRLSGGKVVIAKKFSASHFWQQVAIGRVTWVSVVPTIISILLLNENAIAQYQEYKSQIHLRFLRSSSFALPLKKLTDFEKQFNTQILEGYGMTETASQCTINPIEAPKIGSAGKPFATELKLVADGKLTDEANVVGEIAVRGDHVIADYLEPHADSFTNGWFLTGDLGYLDEDGYLFVKGRRKEMISRGGEKVAPAKVENVLNELPFVEQVAVIGLPDDLYGEEVTAVIVLKEPKSSKRLVKEEVLNYTEHKLAKFERPTKILFVDKFPRNTTGKVVRPKLRDELLATMVGGNQ
ncbi:Long-chain-fatty-acid--CoA ligase [Pediococcus damnosus]|uniref:Long-chain-fatty-acid--CoA ligase n=1 Tax=Pediococcus damnosus TaxID=51663 RepID=A0A0R2HMU1_9LACO|nr:AMP-binding protein [Pediococcus damnosus]AMV61068.1 Long-chain-fatty-acid--CoA ligase [Pediococcus damnosus]AMV63633.1 Long-chain-fatty-acid--CoA ligase [Pediococcus damnosus]AMV65428.1 Long-chain-fatty-acid--CoA ligase [Pediococcus damnosus]AMV66426.1 Long-chain-fatty-acid--CoA ligase [Pediococcus damnosus]KJU73270.1 acyl-CoA synthetase [Pediococcus damnosus LMG 28219]